MKESENREMMIVVMMIVIQCKNNDMISKAFKRKYKYGKS